jgi:NTE family protein
MLPDFLTRRIPGGQSGAAAGSPDLPALRKPAPRQRPLLGLALGGGAARGWAHIGVIRRLLKAGYVPDVIAGTSIGAVVGGCYAAGKLDELEYFARSLTKRRVFGLMDFHIGSGVLGGERLKRLLERDLTETQIETLKPRFAAIATEIGSGHEIWLTRGPLVSAMRASYALPGVFDPVKLGGRWLFDGALVNPVPVTAARALAADVVIAVNINADMFGRGSVIHDHGGFPNEADEVAETFAQGLFSPVRGAVTRLRRLIQRPTGPTLAKVMVETFNITQDRIARSRLAGDPPDVHLKPKLGRVGLFEFHRAAEAIALGEDAVEQALPDIAQALELVDAASGE